MRQGSSVALHSIAAAWVLSLAIDLFLHAGLLARLYAEPSPFLLPAEDAFRRIPLGYLTFLILTIGLFWLLRRLDVRGIAAGFRVAAIAGGTVWGALVLGLYSISTASVSLLAGWWVGQTVELAFAGAVLGAAANRVPLKRIWAVVGVAVVVLAAATVVLQTLGLAPAMKVVPSRLDGQQQQGDMAFLRLHTRPMVAGLTLYVGMSVIQAQSPMTLETLTVPPARLPNGCQLEVPAADAPTPTATPPRADESLRR